MRRPFRSRCFGTCHFCIKTSRHGYKLHAIVCKLQELKLQYSVISYLSYHSFNILDDFPKSDITYFLFITVPSAVRRPPSAVRIRRPHPHFTESQASRANVKFLGQSLSQGHYQPIYQQAGKGFIYFITLSLIFFSQFHLA